MITKAKEMCESGYDEIKLTDSTKEIIQSTYKSHNRERRIYNTTSSRMHMDLQADISVIATN